MSEDPDSRGESVEEIATFLSSDVEAFRTLGGDQLTRLAAAVTHRELAAGETLIVEGGPPARSSGCCATAFSICSAGTSWSP